MSQIQDVCRCLYVFNSVEFDYSHRSIYGVDPEAQVGIQSYFVISCSLLPLISQFTDMPHKLLEGSSWVFWVVECIYDLRSLI